MDALSRVLTLVQSELCLDVLCQFSGDFTIDHKSLSSDEAMFHIVLSGNCWLLSPKGEALQLKLGSFVFLPQGSEHQLSSTKEAVHTPPIVEENMTGSLLIKKIKSEKKESNVELLCGRIKYTKGGGMLLMQCIPSLICISLTSDPGLAILNSLNEVVIYESLHPHLGTLNIINSIAQILLTYALRRYIESNQTNSSWLNLLIDKRLGRSVQAMLNSPERAWSLKSLGNIASMSRATYARVFKQKSGITPAKLLLSIRMMHATKLLLNSNSSLSIISEAVGYRSEAAFSKAFKQVLGMTPGQWRCQH